MDYPAKRQYEGILAQGYDRRVIGTAIKRLESNREFNLLKELAASCLRPNAMILDAPTGTARFLPMLQQLGHHVTGIDISRDMLKVANGRFRNGVVALVEGDCEALPFKDETFDYVVSIRYMGHVPPQAKIKVLREFRRVSRKGLVVAFPILNPLTALRFKLGNILHRVGTGKRRSWWPGNAKSLGDDLTQAGLRVRQKRWLLGPFSQIAFLYLEPTDLP